MRSVFQEAVARGELSATAWLQPERKSLESDLKDTIGILNDRKLGRLAKALSACWNEAFASSPPSVLGGINDVVVMSFDDKNRDERRQRHDVAIHDGVEVAQRVVDRANTLERVVAR
jgi:hypothetical protein